MEFGATDKRKPAKREPVRTWKKVINELDPMRGYSYPKPCGMGLILSEFSLGLSWQPNRPTRRNLFCQRMFKPNIIDSQSQSLLSILTVETIDQLTFNI